VRRRYACGPGRRTPEECDIQQWEATIADLKEGCALAADARLLITLERHGGTVTNTLWGCQRTLDEVDSPALKINYQVGTVNDTATLAEEIRILGARISSIATRRIPGRLMRGFLNKARGRRRGLGGDHRESQGRGQ